MSVETLIPPYNASDPHATFLSSSCFDFLLIEVVPLAYRTAAAISRPVITTGKNASNTSSTTGAGTGTGTSTNAPANLNIQATGSGERERKASTSGTSGKAAAETGAASGASGIANAGTLTEDDAQREIVSKRLEALGYRVGQGLVERFSRDRPRFTDALDVIKFLCKDLWMLLFRKQIDNLKTNHRGVYVLTDNTFRPFSRMSMKTSAEALEKAQPFLWFPCGIIRGTLASLGIQAVVQAESMGLPGAVFQIKTITTTKG